MAYSFSSHLFITYHVIVREYSSCETNLLNVLKVSKFYVACEKFTKKCLSYIYSKLHFPVSVCSFYTHFIKVIIQLKKKKNLKIIFVHFFLLLFWDVFQEKLTDRRALKSAEFVNFRIISCSSTIYFSLYPNPFPEDIKVRMVYFPDK